MNRSVLAVFVFAALVARPSPARAQVDMSDPLLDMQAIARALGVQCNYCHVRSEENNRTDFKSDANPKKGIARLMIAMTRDLNTSVQAAVGKSAADTLKVHCSTCHRGVPVPMGLTDVLLRTIRDKGIEGAIAEYRDLRSRFYARDTYDFRESEILNLGQRLADSRPDDAIALMTMNLEFNPKSAQSYIVMSRAYQRKRDNAAAIAQLKKALEIDPENGMAKGYLYQLDRSSRPQP